jgi:predicted flavoprotein YhiN
LKNIVATAGGMVAKGELVLTRYGLEGGVIYQLGPALRQMKNPAITIDFKPTFTRDQLIGKMESVKRGFLDEAKVRWKLSDAAASILGSTPWLDASSLADAVKQCVIPLRGPRPIEEAISSAGGVSWRALDDGLMLWSHPGIFLAGEMIDWDAPTGGYLMQGCFATGTRAGKRAAAWEQATGEDIF